MAYAHRRPVPKPDPPSESTMGFLEHLDELRTRIIRSCLAVAAGMAVALVFHQRLGNFVLEPTLRILPPGSELIYTRHTEMFAFYFNVALIGGVILAAPFVSYQVWRFIAPGLHANEKRLVVPFVLFATAGAVGGFLFSHYVLFPTTLSFFSTFGSPRVKFMPRVEDTFDQYLKMLLAMVFVFQLPPVVFVLARLRIVTARLLWRNVKYAILVIFVAAAVLTASPDVWNQTVFAAPMLVLYALSIVIAWLVEPRSDAAPSHPVHSDDGLRLVFTATVLEQARRRGSGRTPRAWRGRVV